MDETADQPVFLVRLAGLPASSVESLSDEELVCQADALVRIEDDLDRARGELVEGLYPVIGTAPSRQRRELLALKRDAFNGRSLRRYRDRPVWSRARQCRGEVVDEVLRLEEDLGDARADFTAAYEGRRRHALEALLGQTARPGLLRGLALSSPALADTLRRKADDLASLPARKLRKLELSLLRYVSRTAVKLSPFSTLTRVGLGTMARLPPSVSLVLVGPPWRERSLLRLRRYLLEQLVMALGRHPSSRERSRVVLNCTAETSADEGYRFLRPDAWEPDSDGQRLRYRALSLARVELAGPLVSWLWDELPGRRLTHEELTYTLAEDLGADRDDVAATVDQLLDLGFLERRTPWPSHAGHLEKDLLEHLRALPDGDGDLARATARLSDLVALEAGFSRSRHPQSDVRQIDRTLDEVWKPLASRAGFRPELKLARQRPRDVFEDVFLSSATGAGAIVRLSRATAERLVSQLEPWARLAGLQGHRLDFLHTAAAFMERTWPAAREVGALELFGAIQPLWREFRKFEARSCGPVESWARSFNPLDLERVERLRRAKQRLRNEVEDLFREAESPGHADPEELASCLDDVPPGSAAPSGGCFFLQSADTAGKLWVLNRVFEGTGRYGSRFTAVMDAASRRRYVEPMRRASAVETPAGPAELLDLMWSRGDTLNVHAVQTRWVLESPGETLDPSARRLSVRDLRVRRGQDSALPELVDRSGRRFLPVHLGGAATAFLPSWLQFLTLWGAREIRDLRLGGGWRREGALRVRGRWTLGDVVVRRKRWIVAAGDLGRRIADRPRDRAFVELRRWLEERGLPERVFLIEKVRHEKLDELYKPQYLDLSSPLFTELLASATTGGNLVFEELLPGPAAFPADEAGVRWGVELGLDTLVARS